MENNSVMTLKFSASTVKSILYGPGNICYNNTIPGTTTFRLTGNGSYNVTPQSNSCGSVSVTGGGGGGGGGAPAGDTSTQQTSTTSTSGDGTSVTTISTSSGGTASATATINTVASPTNSQTVSLNTSAVADVNSVNVGLSSSVMQEMVSSYGSDTDLTVNITSQTASSDQRSNTALGSGTFLVGYDVFTIDISAGDTSITSFTNPLTLSFDVSTISNPENLSIAWFDTAQNKWVELGGTLSGGILTISVNHLTDFAVIRKAASAAEAEAITTRQQQIANILDESALVNDSSADLSSLLAHNGATQNNAEQTASMEKYTNALTAGITGLTTENTYAINNFIVYGTQTTKILGAGERAGVVNSYKAAFGKLPTDADSWADVIKIANGRWPSETSQTAEDRAKTSFQTIYLREANMANPNDNAAVTIMAYGLRPDVRNLNSEKVAIKTFKAIFGYNPVKATAWDAVRAIAYSGAIR